MEYKELMSNHLSTYATSTIGLLQDNDLQEHVDRGLCCSSLHIDTLHGNIDSSANSLAYASIDTSALYKKISAFERVYQRRLDHISAISDQFRCSCVVPIYDMYSM